MSGHSHGGHSHGGHSHGGHSHGEVTHPGHGVDVKQGFVAAERPSERVTPPLARGAGRGKTLFFDLPSGIAGDMTIASLLDLGAPASVVSEAIAALELERVELRVEHGYAGSIGCTHVDVVFEAQALERSFVEIRELILRSCLAPDVKQLSLTIFERLAHAEAQVHQSTLDAVHFHEVGAIDAIVDIVGSAALFRYLEARVVASPVPLGRGFVDCRHGRLPLPAPATLLCLEGVPTVPSGLEAELVTPTGAAILATVAEEFGDWFSVVPERIGWGAGTRGLPDRPNAARVVLGRDPHHGARPTHVLLEANVDDMTGEAAAFAMDRVFSAGALDVWTTPIHMKKGRPALLFSALADDMTHAAVASAMLRHTTTLGVRQQWVSRRTLEREIRAVTTPWGQVRVKLSGQGAERVPWRVKPEFEDCARIAEREGLSLAEVVRAALVASEKMPFE